jgi:L-seryl-tRNA(Ser) seleniumtransferase
MQKVLEAAGAAPEGWARTVGPEQLHTLAQRAVTQVRERIAGVAQTSNGQDAVSRENLLAETLTILRAMVQQQRVGKLKRVVNATGVVLHTNLGRAPLGARVLSQLQESSRGYATLEYELSTGQRGKREQLVRAQLCALTGAEDALVVNNCAAAVLLACTAFAVGARGFVVSRGELVEIGGGFRVPEVIVACGAQLVEVGTTNKTRIGDYARALDGAVPIAAILAVHRSNFAIEGFTEQPERRALAQLARDKGVLFLEDLGSGALIDLSAYGLSPERTVRQAIEDGADVVMCSGDKLMGGPQAGILLGKSQAITLLAAHPLMRALRPGRLVYAALDAVLSSYIAGTEREDLPALAALTAPPLVLRDRAERVRQLLVPMLDRSLAERWSVTVEPTDSRVGGGTLPTAKLPSWCLSLAHSEQPCVILLEQTLRTGLDVPVIGRIEQGALKLDVRTMFEDDLSIVVQGLAQALRTVHREA